MTSYPDPTDNSTSFEQAEDLHYQLNGGPLDGAIICVDADLTRDQALVRITIEGVQFAYVGDTLSEALDFIEDASHLGHAWRPVRWIQHHGETHIFSDDRPVMEVQVQR